MKHKRRTLAGVHYNAILQQIYDALCDGQKLTNLDGLKSSRTMYLPKYISILRTEYHIPIKDKWICVGERIVGNRQKQVKLYWIDMAD